MSPNESGGPGSDPRAAAKTIEAAPRHNRSAADRSADLVARLIELGPVGLAIVLSLLPAELLAAAVVGLDVAHLRADQRLADAIGADYAGGRWHRNHPLIGHSELMRRRWPPTGDRDLWVRHGPDGPPWWHRERAA